MTTEQFSKLFDMVNSSNDTDVKLAEELIWNLYPTVNAGWKSKLSRLNHLIEENRIKSLYWKFESTLWYNK